MEIPLCVLILGPGRKVILEGTVECRCRRAGGALSSHVFAKDGRRRERDCRAIKKQAVDVC